MPIVEPEVLHGRRRTRSSEAGRRPAASLQAVYTELHDQRVDFRGDAAEAEHGALRATTRRIAPAADEVADATLECFYKHVPAAVPGIVFLSGGQSDEDATAHLNAMNARGPHPWQLSFSYGRALQAPALKAWGGKPENVEAAQRAYYHRAKMNGAARTGMYAPEMEREAVTRLAIELAARPDDQPGATELDDVPAADLAGFVSPT